MDENTLQNGTQRFQKKQNKTERKTECDSSDCHGSADPTKGGDIQDSPKLAQFLSY